MGKESHQAFDSKQRSLIMRIKIFLILVVVLQKVGSNKGLLLSCAAIVKYNVLIEVLSLDLQPDRKQSL